MEIDLDRFHSATSVYFIVLSKFSDEDWHLPLTMDKSQSKYHILPNSSLEIAFYKTSMADNYNHPQYVSLLQF